MRIMKRKFKTAGLGGTFDELHKGHRALLTKAFEEGDFVIIGMSSNQFAKKMGKPHPTSSFAQRSKELENFLDSKGLRKRAKIVEINDVLGGVAQPDSPVEALIVSTETQREAAEINSKRKELGLRQVEIIAINMVRTENHVPISTTRIKRGEIDREGHSIK